MTPSERDVAEVALDRLLEIAVLLGEDTRRHLAARGLSTSRAHLLYALRSEGPQTQQTLARTLDLSPRSITTLVDQLVESGHVKRQPHPTDRRAVLVQLSDHGTSVATELTTGRATLADELFRDWSAGDRRDLLHGLDAVLERLRSTALRSAAGSPPDRPSQWRRSPG